MFLSHIYYTWNKLSGKSRCPGWYMLGSIEEGEMGKGERRAEHSGLASLAQTLGASDHCSSSN